MFLYPDQFNCSLINFQEDYFSLIDFFKTFKVYFLHFQVLKSDHLKWLHLMDGRRIYTHLVLSLTFELQCIHQIKVGSPKQFQMIQLSAIFFSEECPCPLHSLVHLVLVTLIKYITLKPEIFINVSNIKWILTLIQIVLY